MAIRGIRGATTIGNEDSADAVLARTKELIQAIMEVNPTLETAEIASVLFTVTGDIHSAFPALAARELGWEQVPLMCAAEIAVPGSVPFCIRILIHWNTELAQDQVNHVYLHEAVRLRPDLVEKQKTI